MRRGLRRQPETAQLNLLPFMNVFSLLIPFLLIGAAFLKLTVLEASLPAAGSAELTKKKEKKQTLNLTVAITDKGFYVGGAGAVLAGREGEPTVPLLPDGKYDFEALSKKLLEVKRKFPNNWNVIILPEDKIPYQTIVKTMDITREIHIEAEKCPGVKNPEPGKKIRCVMFPNVAIAAGVL